MINIAFKELDENGFTSSQLKELLKEALSKINKQTDKGVHFTQDQDEEIEESASEIIRNLRDFKVLKEYGKAVTSREQLESNENSNFDKSLNSENEDDNLQESEDQEINNVDMSLDSADIKFKFDFVGIVEIEGISLFIFPKYIENLKSYLLPQDEINKSLNKKESEIELENKSGKLSEIESKEDLESKDRIFENFLIKEGIACFQDSSKVTNDKDNFLNKIKDVVAVIYKYKKSNISFTSQEEDGVFSVVSTTIKLLHSYFEHGLYFNERDIIEQEGEGEIFWDKTINECTPYFFNKAPYYLDFYRFNKEIPEESFFKQLHAAILTEASGTIQTLLKILDLEVISLTSQSIDSFGNLDYLITRINKELSNQFITYKQEILILMKNYLSFKKQSQGLENQLYFYGTGRFYTIWEAACSEYYENCLKNKISDIFNSRRAADKKYLKAIKENKYFQDHKDKTLNDLIPKPKWKISKENLQLEKKTLVPDIIKIDLESNSMEIYDAKYYLPNITKNNIQNQPGIADIDKQFIYLLVYLKFSKEMNLKITKNCFIMPKRIYPEEDKTKEEHIEVSFDLFNKDFFISVLGVKERDKEEGGKEYCFEDSDLTYSEEELANLTKIKVEFLNPTEVFNKCLGK